MLTKLVRDLSTVCFRNVKHFTFVATTGRSGSQTLARIFAAAPGCLSLHEPEPVMNGLAMINKNRGSDSLARRTFYTRKLPRIYRECRSAKARYYVETNHMFIKSFHEFAIEYFYPRINVVHLKRNPRANAYSIYQLNELPGTPIGNRWYLDYQAPGNLIKLPPVLERFPEFRQPFYVSLWYVLEIEERIKRFRSTYPEVPCFQIATEQLNDMATIKELLAFLRMEIPEEALAQVVGKKNNEYTEFKKKMGMPVIAPAAQEEMVQRFCGVLHDTLGYESPLAECATV